MWSENQSVNNDKLQPLITQSVFFCPACRLGLCLCVIEKPVLIMWVPFVSRQTVNTRWPRVRQSDQLHQAARNVGHSDHWTGSSVSVFPLDMTSVQLLAGKTTRIHTMKEMEVHKIGCMPTANQFLTWTLTSADLCGAECWRQRNGKTRGNDWQRKEDEQRWCLIFCQVCSLLYHTAHSVQPPFSLNHDLF